MRVLGISWAGARTSDFDGSLHFFEQTLGLKVALQQGDFAVLKTPTGDAVEIFGPGAPISEPHQFDHNAVVVGLLVDDIDGACAAIEAGGGTLLGETTRTAEGYAWRHFLGPDGNTWEVTFDPTHPALR